jgi:hypothetical protein
MKKKFLRYDLVFGHAVDFADEIKKLSPLRVQLIKRLMGTAASKHFDLLVHEVNQEIKHV